MTAYPVIAAALAVMGTAQASTGPASGLAGSWGGEHIRLTVTDSGARIALDCGAGAFPMPVTLDRRGRFSARGTWQVYHPGPARADEPAAAAPASFRGQLVGDRLTLEVSATALSAPQRYVLTRNSRIKLIRCL